MSCIIILQAVIYFLVALKTKILSPLPRRLGGRERGKGKGKGKEKGKENREKGRGKLKGKGDAAR